MDFQGGLLTQIRHNHKAGDNIKGSLKDYYQSECKAIELNGHNSSEALSQVGETGPNWRHGRPARISS
jgi:hypothetical protein